MTADTPVNHDVEQTTAPEAPESALAGPLDGASVAALAAELEQVRAQYARAMADYQNLRRRSQEAQAELSRQTLAALVSEYLPVLDDLTRALGSVDETVAQQQWLEGVRMVQRKFQGVLEAQGVHALTTLGQPFNPAAHEAIGYGPGPEGTVVFEMQAGYAIGDRVIRPARVVVGDGSAPASADATAASTADSSA